MNFPKRERERKTERERETGLAGVRKEWLRVREVSLVTVRD